MALESLDTEGDAVASLVRGIRRLDIEEIEALLEAARGRDGDSARHRLIEHHLGVALDAALACAPGLLTFDDAFQEASVVLVATVSAYVGGDGDAAGLGPRLAAAVRDHLSEETDRRQQALRADRRMAEDAEALEAALFAIRRRTGAPATAVEAAAALEWPLERVAIVSEVIAAARARYDQEISAYVDDQD